MTRRDASSHITPSAALKLDSRRKQKKELNENQMTITMDETTKERR
jgi:hypothetical protein